MCVKHIVVSAGAVMRLYEPMQVHDQEMKPANNDIAGKAANVAEHVAVCVAHDGAAAASAQHAPV